MESTAERKFAFLRQNFLDSAPRKIEAARSAWLAYCKHPEPAQLDRVMLSLRALAASADVYRIATLATSSEHALTTLQQVQTGPGLTDAVASEMEQRWAAMAAELARLHLARPESGGTEGDHRRTLVYTCDDDEMQAKILAVQLCHFGFAVQSFAQVTDLIRAVTDHRPDAILMDVSFPDGELAGLEAVVALQRDLPHDLPPVCVVSGSDQFESRLLAARAGVSAYFLKPVDINVLTEHLDKITARLKEWPFRVLLVDPDANATSYYSSVLQAKGMLTREVERPEQVLTAIDAFSPDLMLIDHELGACSGAELARIVRQCHGHIDLPIIFLSAVTDPTVQMRSRAAGGDDFLVEPVAPEPLAELVRVRAERYRYMHKMIMHDGLTGVLNHAAIHEALRRDVALMARAADRLAVVLLDVDLFKQVNDNHGHPAGDQVLKSLARMLRQRLRTADIVGRYGGEEFMMVMRHTDAAQARLIVDAIRQDFARINHRLAGGEIQVSFSAGIAGYPTYPEVEVLIDAADRALYQAKQSGRNCVVALWQ